MVSPWDATQVVLMYFRSHPRYTHYQSLQVRGNVFFKDHDPACFLSFLSSSIAELEAEDASKYEAAINDTRDDVLQDLREEIELLKSWQDDNPGQTVIFRAWDDTM